MVTEVTRRDTRRSRWHGFQKEPRLELTIQDGAGLWRRGMTWRRRPTQGTRVCLEHTSALNSKQLNVSVFSVDQNGNIVLDACHSPQHQSISKSQ